MRGGMSGAAVIVAVALVMTGCSGVRTVLRNGAHAAEYFVGSEAELTAVLKAASTGADSGAEAAQFADDVNRLTESSDNPAVWARLCRQAASWVDAGRFTPSKQDLWDMAVSAVAVETTGGDGVDDLQASLGEWVEGRADDGTVINSLRFMVQTRCAG